MKFIILLLLTVSSALAGIQFKVNWTAELKKEVQISCTGTEVFCQKLCQKNSCLIQEKPCRDCIGTSIKMNYIITELGRLIVNSGKQSNYDVYLDLFQREELVVFSPQDVYNVVDPVQSVRTFKKFEALCHGPTTAQLVFFGS